MKLYIYMELARTGIKKTILVEISEEFQVKMEIEEEEELLIRSECKKGGL